MFPWIWEGGEWKCDLSTLSSDVPNSKGDLGRGWGTTSNTSSRGNSCQRSGCQGDGGREKPGREEGRNPEILDNKQTLGGGIERAGFVVLRSRASWWKPGPQGASVWGARKSAAAREGACDGGEG